VCVCVESLGGTAGRSTASDLAVNNRYVYVVCCSEYSYVFMRMYVCMYVCTHVFLCESRANCLSPLQHTHAHTHTHVHTTIFLTTYYNLPAYLYIPLDTDCLSPLGIKRYV